jgi:hypothetical protein
MAAAQEIILAAFVIFMFPCSSARQSPEFLLNRS